MKVEVEKQESDTSFCCWFYSVDLEGELVSDPKFQMPNFVVTFTHQGWEELFLTAGCRWKLKFVTKMVEMLSYPSRRWIRSANGSILIAGIVIMLSRDRKYLSVEITMGSASIVHSGERSVFTELKFCHPSIEHQIDLDACSRYDVRGANICLLLFECQRCEGELDVMRWWEDTVLKMLLSRLCSPAIFEIEGNVVA